MATTHRVFQSGSDGYLATNALQLKATAKGLLPNRQNVRRYAFAWLLVCLAAAIPGRLPANQPLQAGTASAIQIQNAYASSPHGTAAWQPAEVDVAVRECISVAQEFGYRNGQCAYEFIAACLTGSPSRVMQEYGVDRARGLVGASSCPSMPANYLVVFKQF